MHDFWQSIASPAGPPLEPGQLTLLDRYLDLLLQANEKMNLTRIVDRASAEVMHVGDSLTLLPHMPGDGKKVVDVGSGGGVPGIVLAIARPQTKFVLVESTQKKAQFLQSAVAELGLGNVVILAKRVEEVARSSQRESFDVAMARAVATVVWLAEWMLPLVRVGGTVLMMKGPKAQEELPQSFRAIRFLGGAVPETLDAGLIDPATQIRASHVILRIKKQYRSPLRYPRPAPEAKATPMDQLAKF